MKQIREENNNNGKRADKMHVKEWLHQNAKRPVKVKFGPDEAFYLLNRKGDKLRTINVKVSLLLKKVFKTYRHVEKLWDSKVKFRESNGFTDELTKELISRNVSTFRN